MPIVSTSLPLEQSLHREAVMHINLLVTDMQDGMPRDTTDSSHP